MLEFRPELYVFVHDEAPSAFPIGERELSEKTARSAQPTILVVDDQRMIADTTALVLNQSGFHAIRAYSGPSALELALKIKPDYLLSDILMPGVTGVELAIAIRKQLPTTFIVLISGQAGITDILRLAKEAGHEFDLLAKPIHPEKLLKHLKDKAPEFWM